jgi:hypothetical protein
LALAAAAFALVVALEVTAPEPVDWTPSYQRDDARPFAGQVLYDVLPQLFPGARRSATTRPPYLELRAMQADSSTGGSAGQSDSTTYLFLAQEVAPDPAEARRFLHFVRAGGTVFAAAEAFAGPSADSLGLRVERRPPAVPGRERDSTTLRFTSPSLGDAGARFRPGLADAYFAAFDTARATVLGRSAAGEEADSAARATFLRVDAGDGAFYLSSTPRAFSNYALLEGGAGSGGNARYAYAALSHVPPEEAGRLLWDGHYKPARAGASTPLRVVLARPALRSAYVLLLVAALVFAVFEGRRRQRAVPVVEPPENETAGFVRTVGRLYFERGDHAHLAQKKIVHFRTYARERLRLRNPSFDDDEAPRVAERSGVPVADVRALFETLAEAEGRERLSEERLQTISRRLHDFYRQSRR